MAERVAVIGVTSWGLVLARLFADAGSSVILLARSEGEAEIVPVQRTHPERLREIRLPSSVDITVDCDLAVGEAAIVVFPESPTDWSQATTPRRR